MAQAIVLPSLGGDSNEGTLLNWLKQPGDAVKPDDVIAEVEADKATIEVPASVEGVVLQLVGSVGDTLKVGSVIAYVGAAGEAAPTGGTALAPQRNGAPVTAAPSPAPAAPPAAPIGDDDAPGGVKASPIARRLAEERGIDLRQVTGSGPGGRIVKADIENFAAPSAQAAPAAVPAIAPAPMLAAPAYGELPSGPDVEIIDVTRVRSRIAARMVQSKQQVPHFYVTSEIDTAALMALRTELNAELPEERKITVNDLIVKAAALTLVGFPNLNTHFYGDKLVRHKRIHIGIAVALPNGGLINVVAKDADKTSISNIAAANKAMIARAREGKVKPEDVQGSTFTVSNLGGYDVEHFLAIINPPEAAILAVASARPTPIVLADGTLGVGSRMKATISVDHRVSDGAEGAQFMQAFKALIENPLRLLV